MLQRDCDSTICTGAWLLEWCSRFTKTLILLCPSIPPLAHTHALPTYLPPFLLPISQPPFPNPCPPSLLLLILPSSIFPSLYPFFHACVPLSPSSSSFSRLRLIFCCNTTDRIVSIKLFLCLEHYKCLYMIFKNMF